MFENLFTSPSAEEKANKAFAELAHRIDSLDKRIGQLSAVYNELQTKGARPFDYDGLIDRVTTKVIERLHERIMQFETRRNKESADLFIGVNDRLAKLEAGSKNNPGQLAQPPGSPDFANPSKYTVNTVDAASIACTTSSRLYYLAVRGRLGYLQRGRSRHIFYNIEDLVKLREKDLAKSSARIASKAQCEIPTGNGEAK
jgi:hypothetical protein